MVDPRTFVGVLRSPTVGDITGLVLHSSTHHLGFPPGAHVAFPAGAAGGPRIYPDQKRLRPGDVYLFTADSFLTHALGIPGFVPNLVEDFLIQLGKLAAAEAANVVGLVPLAWTVPTAKELQMPRPAHVRMTFNGVFGSLAAPSEIWSFGVNAAPGDQVTTQQQLQDAAAAMVAAYTASIRPNQRATVVLTEAVYALVGGDGHVQTNPDGSYRQAKQACNVAGNAAAAGYLPLQTALVISLTTPRPGATGRGRFFVPFQSGPDIENDFRINTAAITSWAQHAGNFIAALNVIDGDVCVASSKGYLSLVTGVRVGRVPDTMRSRRDRLDEGYVPAPIVAG